MLCPLTAIRRARTIGNWLGGGRPCCLKNCCTGTRWSCCTLTIKRLGASSGSRSRQFCISSVRTSVSSNKLIPPRLNATICTALLRPCRARLANTWRLPSGSAASSRRLDHATAPNSSSPAARPPSTAKPSLTEPACHKNSAHNTAAPDVYTMPVLLVGIPSSRRMTRSGDTAFNCHKGKKVKPSNSAMPLIVACSKGSQPGEGRWASRSASTACTRDDWAAHPSRPPSITARMPSSKN